MLQLLDLETQAELRRDYLSDKLFGTLFPGLAELERIYGELSPTMVWTEAIAVTDKLGGLENIDLEVIQVYNDLKRKYREFLSPAGERIDRSENHADYTTVCVMTCVNFQLVARPDNLSTEDCDNAIQEILKLVGRHAIHAHLYKAQRKREEILDKKNRPADKRRIADKELSQLFTQLFRATNFAELTGFVKYCEANMSFTSKIDRFAYMMFAAQKSWLKSAKTFNVQGWTKFMNNILAPNQLLTQSEVSRRYNAIRGESAFDSYTGMVDTFNVQAKNLPAKSYNTLKENVKLMHTMYRQYQKIYNKEENGKQ